MLRHDPLANPERLLQRVYTYVAYRIGPGPDAEDVTSETYARALRSRDTYDPARGTPVAWLIGIARRCLAEAMAARPLLSEPLDAADAGDLEEQSIRRLTLAAAIASLLADPARRVALAGRAREWAVSRRGPEHTVDAFEALYERLLS